MRKYNINNLKAKIVGQRSLQLNGRVSIIFILITTCIIGIDSTIVEYLSYSDVIISSQNHVLIFVCLFSAFATTGILLLILVKNVLCKSSYKLSGLRYSHYSIFFIELITIVIIQIILFQIYSINRYHISTLVYATYLSHISALSFLVMLVLILARWLKSRRDYAIVLYIISFVLISGCIITSLAYYNSIFLRAPHDVIRSHPISTYVTSMYYPENEVFLSFCFDSLSLASFLIAWIATILLLSQNRHKIGRLRYFTLTGIPLLYYLFPFQSYFGNLFSPLIIENPITFSVVYTLIFSATNQVGAVLFSLTFLTASRLISQDRIRKSLLISSIGIAILFSSIEIGPLQYKILPPYGLISVALMPLGAYLLYTGISTSAIFVAKDKELRKAIYLSANKQLNLLKSIGVTEMENELVKKFKSIESQSRMIETTEDTYIHQEEVKQMVREVLNELNKFRLKNNDKN